MDPTPAPPARSARRDFWIVSALNVVIAVVALALASCAAPASDAPMAPVDLTVWEAGAPTLSIGVLEGAEEYEFGSIVGVAELPDGRLAVSDGGVGSVSIFSETGEFSHRIGNFGEGPGEFGLPSRVYAQGPDSIAVMDQRRWIVSWFSLDGEWGRQQPASEISGEEVFPMDVFPASRYIVDGAVSAAERSRIGAMVATLPAPTGESLVRWLKVATDGSMWVREVAGDSTTASEWMVLAANGVPARWVRLPAGFTPYGIDGDEIVGRRVGEYGVEYAERYLIAETADTRDVPTWFADPPTRENDEEAVPFSESALRSAAVSSIKNIASHQEIHYSQNYTYTSDISELELEDMPEEMEFTILTAGTRGWAMVVAHPDVATVCALGYGSDTPPGWGKGSVDCGTLDGTGLSRPVTNTDKPPQTKGADA